MGRDLRAFVVSFVIHLLLFIISYYFFVFDVRVPVGLRVFSGREIRLFINGDNVGLGGVKVVSSGDDNVVKSGNEVVSGDVVSGDVSGVKGVVDDVVVDSVVVGEVLDSRALYDYVGGDVSGVDGVESLLELDGWTWDFSPCPDDSTDESGMVVFEIKIDNDGEVVGVRTVSRTISALLEKVYRESLEGLTFSRTVDDLQYADLYTGRVTFVIRVR